MSLLSGLAGSSVQLVEYDTVVPLLVLPLKRLRLSRGREVGYDK